jgi:hypothetical protein
MRGIQILQSRTQSHRRTGAGLAFHLGISDIPRFLNMPRARGRPRRGATWYTFESRRQRQKKFEKAMALASTRRTRKPGRPRTPPMAYVEEITPDEAMQNYPEHSLFTVPDNWNPHTDFGNEAKTPATEISHGHRANHPAEEFTTCYVEEEVPCSADAKADPPSGAPPEEATQSGQAAGTPSQQRK